MSEPQNRLWPDPEYMHKYLDNWKMYIESLELRIEQMKAEHETAINEGQTTINDLRMKLNAAELPLFEKIDGLTNQLRHAQNQISAMEDERNQIIKQLAENLEVPITQVLTLPVLTGQAALLITQAKKMVRENL